MKLKYIYGSFTGFLIILFAGVFGSFTISIALFISFHDFELSLIPKFLILASLIAAPTLILFFIEYFSFNIYRKMVISKGEKKRGNIVDNFYFVDFYAGNREHICRGFKIAVDGSSQPYYVYNFKGICGTKYIKNFARKSLHVSETKTLYNNDAYKYVCSELKKIEDVGNGEFKLRSFPIDVYFYKEKYYFDLNSVDLSMKSI